MASRVGSLATRTQSAGARFQTRLITMESVTTMKCGQTGTSPLFISSLIK